MEDSQGIHGEISENSGALPMPLDRTQIEILLSVHPLTPVESLMLPC